MKDCVFSLAIFAVAFACAPVQAEEPLPASPTAQAEDLFARVERQLKANDYEGVAQSWTEIEDLLARETVPRDWIVDRLNTLKVRTKWGPTRRSLVLRPTSRRASWSALATFRDLERHCDRMTKADSYFSTAADDLRRRGSELADRARSQGRRALAVAGVAALIAVGMFIYLASSRRPESGR